MASTEALTLQTIINQIEEIERIVDGTSYQEFIKDFVDIGHQTTMQLYMLGMTIQQISRSFRTQHNDVNWNYYARMCDPMKILDPTGECVFFIRLIQSMVEQDTNYIEDDSFHVRCHWRILTHEMPNFKTQVAALLKLMASTQQ